MHLICMLLLTSVLAILPWSLLADRPNILWIDIDDQSPWYSVYGDETVKTPNLDVLASAGVVFEQVYAADPVCLPSRSAMVTRFAYFCRAAASRLTSSSDRISA